VYALLANRTARRLGMDPFWRRVGDRRAGHRFQSVRDRPIRSAFFHPLHPYGMAGGNRNQAAAADAPSLRLHMAYGGWRVLHRRGGFLREGSNPLLPLYLALVCAWWQHLPLCRGDAICRSPRPACLVRCGSVLVVVRDAEFLQLIPKRIAADVEQLGGLRLVPVRFLHGHFYERSLNFFQ